MAEQRRDGSDIRSVLERRRSGTVPEWVQRDAPRLHPDGLGRLREAHAYHVEIEHAAELIGEHEALIIVGAAADSLLPGLGTAMGAQGRDRSRV
jgi:hypothetical protein